MISAFKFDSMFVWYSTSEPSSMHVPCSSISSPIYSNLVLVSSLHDDSEDENTNSYVASSCSGTRSSQMGPFNMRSSWWSCQWCFRSTSYMILVLINLITFGLNFRELWSKDILRSFWSSLPGCNNEWGVSFLNGKWCLRTCPSLKR